MMLGCIFIFNCGYLLSAEITYEELQQQYIPQDNPEATYRLELGLLSKGIYCYDLSIFDPEWRAKGKEILISQSVAQKFYGPFQTYSEGDYAVIYYPQDKSCGPVFLYRNNSGWVLDRTTVIENIHYSPDGSSWFAYDGSYPYLRLLKKIFNLKRGQAGGIPAHMIE
jgi:hypothetical protein